MAVTDQLGVYPGVTGLRRVSNRQMRQWLGANGSPAYIYTVINGNGTLAGISDDPASAENAQFHSGDLVENDTLAARIKALLSFNDTQWSNAISGMLDISL